MATIIRNQDYEQFSQIEDERVRESFRVLYDNTAALQEQVEQLKTKIVESTDLADLQSEVSTLFDGSSTTNAGSGSIPVATSTVLGGVKDGAGVTIAADGTLSVDTHDHDTDYSDSGHNHDGTYSSSGHDHDNDYSASGHNHDGTYSSSGHDHTGVYQPSGNYASGNHDHTGVYSLSNHGHSGFASSSHTHSYVGFSDTNYRRSVTSYTSTAFNSELPQRLSFANYSYNDIYTILPNSTSTNLMIYKNNSFYRWVGLEPDPGNTYATLKQAKAMGYSTSTAMPFAATVRPTSVFLRDGANTLKVLRLFAYTASSGGINLWAYRYTINSTTSTSPTFTFNSSAIIGTVG